MPTLLLAYIRTAAGTIAGSRLDYWTTGLTQTAIICASFHRVVYTMLECYESHYAARLRNPWSKTKSLAYSVPVWQVRHSLARTAHASQTKVIAMAFTAVFFVYRKITHITTPYTAGNLTCMLDPISCTCFVVGGKVVKLTYHWPL